MELDYIQGQVSLIIRQMVELAVRYQRIEISPEKDGTKKITNTWIDEDALHIYTAMQELLVFLADRQQEQQQKKEHTE